MYQAIDPVTRATAFCELSQVASLIWDTVIDSISIAYVVSGGAPSGNSIEIRQYAKTALPIVYRYWKGPVRLHNFQHRPYQSSGLFAEHCEDTADLLTQLNHHLPEPLRLPADSYGWLS